VKHTAIFNLCHKTVSHWNVWHNHRGNFMIIQWRPKLTCTVCFSITHCSNYFESSFFHAFCHAGMRYSFTRNAIKWKPTIMVLRNGSKNMCFQTLIRNDGEVVYFFWNSSSTSQQKNTINSLISLGFDQNKVTYKELKHCSSDDFICKLIFFPFLRTLCIYQWLNQCVLEKHVKWPTDLEWSKISQIMDSSVPLKHHDLSNLALLILIQSPQRDTPSDSPRSEAFVLRSIAWAFFALQAILYTYMHAYIHNLFDKAGWRSKLARR